MNALLLVDVQNDFVPGGALAVPGGDRIIPMINKLQKHFPLVIASQDWHPADHGSFAVNHPGHAVGDTIDLHGLPQFLWPVHCVQGTRGAQFVAELDRSGIKRTFQKGTDPRIDSYSALFDNGHRQSTGLGEFLREQGVTDLYVAGLATDYCVKFTALDAIAAGFNVHLIIDACRGVAVNPGDVEKALADMRVAGVKMLAGDEVIAAVDPQTE